MKLSFYKYSNIHTFPSWVIVLFHFLNLFMLFISVVWDSLCHSFLISSPSFCSQSIAPATGLRKHIPSASLVLCCVHMKEQILPLSYTIWSSVKSLIFQVIFIVPFILWNFITSLSTSFFYMISDTICDYIHWLALLFCFLSLFLLLYLFPGKALLLFSMLKF